MCPSMFGEAPLGGSSTGDPAGAPSGAVIEGSRRTRRAPKVFVLVALAASALVWFSEDALVNTGDYWRVTPFLHIRVPVGSTPLFGYRFTSTQFAWSHQLPGSLLAVVAWTIYHVVHGVGLTGFVPSALYLAEYLVFFVGVYLASNRLKQRNDIATAACFFALFLVFGFILRSFYEESLILMLCPWLYLGLVQLKQRGRVVVFFAAAMLMILSKEQMAVFAPMFLIVMWLYLPRTRRNLLRTAAVGAVFAGGVVVMAHESSVFQLSTSNSFDRTYNGLGFAMGGVASWPTNSNYPTIEYPLKHPSVIPRTSCSAIPTQAQAYLGTTYYPTGNALYDTAYGPDGTAAERTTYTDLLQDASLKNYATYLVNCPTLLPKLAYNAVAEAVKVGYDVLYIRRIPKHLAPPFSVFNSVHNWVLRYLGWIVAISLLSLLAVARGLWRRALLVLSYMAISLSVVVGDGFLEYEKHLLTTFMLLPFVWFFAREEWGLRRAHRRAGRVEAPSPGLPDDDDGVAAHGVTLEPSST
jgi:hypothetical protein